VATSPLILEIQGGLGNQLFQLSALKAFCEDNERFPCIDLYRLWTAKAPRTFDFDFYLLNKIFGNLGVRVLNPIKPNALTKLQKSFFSRINLFNKDKFKSIEVGYQSDPTLGKRVNRIQGYFQSYLYADRVRWKEILCQEFFGSSQYQKLLGKLQAQNPMALHVRGQDYLIDKSGIGTLSRTYFKLGIEKLNAVGENIWVFTDDFEYAQELLKECPGNFYFPDSVNSLTPMESMMLFSKAKKLLLSNSTFAWWAGYLSDADHICAPAKWFEGMEDPNSLIPPRWGKVQSIWSDRN
jgi:hypothetical protein